MAAIKEVSTGHIRMLEAEHVIGRAQTSALCLDKRYVSTQHATLRFTGEHWEIKDLGSRNGTYLDGRRIDYREGHALRVGSRVAFGKAEEEWELVDDAAPRAMAVPLDGGTPVELDGDLLALPSNENPRATIYRTLDGVWVLEQTDSIVPVANLQTFEIDGKTFRFSCHTNVATTTLADPVGNIEIRDLQLLFAVTRDEEHVELRVACGVRTFDLGARAHNYLLLTLGRRRVADSAEGLSPASRGWLSPDDFPHDPAMAPARLNLDVLRIRKQFAALGLADAPGIVERRPRSRQLRVGAEQIKIVTI